MKCYIVRDLLPNYIDNLVSNDTRNDISSHLESCTDCKSIYDQMQAPITLSASIPQKEEINFLRKIERKTVRKVMTSIAIGFGVLLIVFSFMARAFAIGTPVKSTEVNYTTSLDMINYYQRFDPDAPKTDREWVIRFTLKNGKALRAVSEDVYSVNNDGLEIVTGRIIKLYEVQPSPLLYDSSQYSSSYAFGFGYGDDNVNLPIKPVEDDFTITIRFRDKDITYSMIKEGLFELVP